MNDNRNKKPNNAPKFNLNWLYIGLIAVIALLMFSNQDDSASKGATYSEFKDYVEKGYASRIIANKDAGTLRMFVNSANIRDVFKTSAQQTGTEPYVSVDFGSVDKLEEFIDKQIEEKHFLGQLSYERESGFLSSLFWNIVHP